jgi:PAS domain S-box-containing protein
MNDEGKTREQLLTEVQTLRKRVACLEQEAQDRQQMELERERLIAILDATPDFVGIADPKGRALYLNQAARRMVGMPDDEPVGSMLIYDYHPVWVRELFSEALPIAMREGVWSGETAMLTRDGREIPVSQVMIAHKAHPDGRVQFFSTIARDMSKQKRAEEELRAAKEYAETIIQSSGDMIISVDANRNVSEFNPAAERTFGYRREEVVGHSIDHLYADTVTSAPIRDVLRQHGKYTGEVMNRRKDGTLFPSSLSASLMRDTDGKVVGSMGISTDITDKKALERQRADFVAMLTHDIKNPLASILGYVDLLVEETAGRRTADEDDFLQRTKDNVLTISALISNYLDLAKVEAGQLVLYKAEQSLRELLQQVVTLHGSVARRHRLTVTVNIEEDLPEIVGDRSALERVFSNLLRNALKFTPETGKIDIRALYRKKDHVVLVEMQDTGPGIAPEEMPLLFERYRRTMASHYHEGTGLGLFIVKTFVEAHGGRVEVDGNWGHGACFRVILPAM